MIVLPNMPQMIVAYYGTLKIGGVVVLSNPEADAAQIVRQIEQTTPEVLVTLRDFGGLVRAVQKETRLDKIILADVRDVVSVSAYKKLLARWGVDSADDGSQSQELGPGCWLMPELMMDAAQEPPATQVSSSTMLS